MQKHWLGLIGTVCGVGSAGTGLAQTTAQSSADAGALEEVVVTAEKRAENVQTTPIAITALSSKDIEEKGIVKLEDIANSTPGVTISNSGIIKLINIRGLGLALISPNTSSGIINYRDGVLITHEPFLLDAYFDTERIEVLRGPQGTLAGSNSTGGAVLVVSRAPSFDDGTHGYIQQTIGTYADLRTEAAINLPLNAQWAARIAVESETRNSFWTDVGAPGQTAVASNDVPGAVDQHAVRLSLLGKPTDALTVSLKSEYNYNGGTGIAQQPTPYSAYYADASHTPFVLNYDRTDSLTRNVDWRNMLQLDLQVLPGAELRSQTAFTLASNRETDDSDASSFNGQIQSFDVDFRTFTQELDLLSTASGPLQWTLGSFYLQDEVVNTAFKLTNFGTPAAPSAVPQVIQPFGSQKALDYAFFGQSTYDLTSQFQLLAGIRYTENRRWATNSGVHITPPGITVLSPGVYKKGVTTGKLGLNWNADANNLVYVFAARGAKSGGYNTGSPTNPLFGPESVWDYELGWKSTMLDQHLRTQLDTFYMNYTGFQLNVYNPLTLASAVANAAKATISGVEAQIQAQFGGLGIDATGAFVDSSLGSGIQYDTRYTPVIPFNIDGHSLPYSARWTGNAGVQYSFPVGAGTLTPRAQVAYVDSQWATVFQVPNGAYNPARDFIPAHTLLDARLTWSPNAAWLVEAYAKNLTNKTYVQAIAGSGTTNNDIYGDPRTLGAQAKFSF